MPRRTIEESENPADGPTKKRLAPNGNRLPDPLPKGEILTDVIKSQWRLGESIGLGGFGEIYLVSKNINEPVGSNAVYVAKVEPHNNGPLFVEMNFYIRAAKQDMINVWMKEHKLKTLGMPSYLGSGSHVYNGEKFRFIVMPRYGNDLEKEFMKRGRRFHLKTVLSVGLQVLETLEYIHSHGYVHADIKGSNLLLRHSKTNQDNVFLVDFGLASRYMVDGFHKEFKPDLRKAHDGTLEFTSRDAHQGAHSRRGDLEILGYNMLQWLCSRLPWETDDTPPNPDEIHIQKESFMSNPSTLMNACFPDSEPPAVLEEYLKYVASLGFETKPDYEYCKHILHQGLSDAGFTYNGRLHLNSLPTKAHKKATKKRPSEEPENIAMLKPVKIKRFSPACPCKPKNCNTRATRSSPTTTLLRSHEHFDWERVLSSNPEKNFGKRGSTDVAKKSLVPTPPLQGTAPAQSLQQLRATIGLDNPTPAMLELMEARHRKLRSSSGSLNVANKRIRCESSSLSPENIPTPAMEQVMLMMQQRMTLNATEEWSQKQGKTGIPRRRKSRGKTLAITPALKTLPTSGIYNRRRLRSDTMNDSNNFESPRKYLKNEKRLTRLRSQGSDLSSSPTKPTSSSYPTEVASCCKTEENSKKTLKSEVLDSKMVVPRTRAGLRSTSVADNGLSELVLAQTSPNSQQNTPPSSVTLETTRTRAGLRNKKPLQSEEFFESVNFKVPSKHSEINQIIKTAVHQRFQDLMLVQHRKAQGENSVKDMPLETYSIYCTSSSTCSSISSSGSLYVPSKSSSYISDEDVLERKHQISREHRAEKCKTWLGNKNTHPSLEVYERKTRKSLKA